MYRDPSDPENKYYKCGIESQRVSLEKRDHFLSFDQNRKEEIQDDGVTADMDSRPYKTKSSQSSEVYRMGLLLNKCLPESD